MTVDYAARCVEDDEPKRALALYILRNSGFRIWLADRLVAVAGVLNPWRGHFCQYHQGFEDGYDAALAAAPAENPDLLIRLAVESGVLEQVGVECAIHGPEWVTDPPYCRDSPLCMGSVVPIFVADVKAKD